MVLWFGLFLLLCGNRGFLHCPAFGWFLHDGSGVGTMGARRARVRAGRACPGAQVVRVRLVGDPVLVSWSVGIIA